jgi:hypothetical protein
MSTERRTEPRETVELALCLRDGRRAVTRNVSSSGLFFETEPAPALGDLVDLEVALDTGWGQLCLQARAEVVRLEEGSPGTGVGVRIVDSRLMPLD